MSMTRPFSGGRITSETNGAGKIKHPCAKECRWTLTLYTKPNSRQIKDLNLRELK